MLAPPRSPHRTSWNPGGTLVEPSWNLTSGPPQTTPEPIWAETTKLSAVGKKKRTRMVRFGVPTSEFCKPRGPVGQLPGSTAETGPITVHLWSLILLVHSPRIHHRIGRSVDFQEESTSQLQRFLAVFQRISEAKTGLVQNGPAADPDIR